MEKIIIFPITTWDTSCLGFNCIKCGFWHTYQRGCIE